MYNELFQIIQSTSNENNAMLSPRVIYNGFYLLNLLLFWFKNREYFIVNSDLDRKICQAFKLEDDKAGCYTHATLETPFKTRKKGERDPLAESGALVSGVVGHFSVLQGKKREQAILNPDASQFIVLETTLNKTLKKGPKRIPYYHQIAKDIGCMLKALSRLDNPFLENLGLFVIAPKELLKLDSFKSYTYKKNIEELMHKRAQEYGQEETQDYLLLFDRLFPRFIVDCLSYEDIIRFIRKNDNDYGERVDKFYKICMNYHGI